MAFRTVVIKTPSKLELNLGYLVHRTVDKTTRILIKEIHTLIIQSTAVTITSALICELNENKVKIIFCDSKNNPNSEVVPYYNNVQSSKYIKHQMFWQNNIKAKVWKIIINAKILNQARNLRKYNFLNQECCLIEYANDIQDGDVTNREGHAAKVYFNALFGSDFSRSSDNYINAFLNYGYSIILSQINREVVSAGYITQIGIHHKNANNQFNLSCDLMEPFRPIVDDKAKEMDKDDDFKKTMIDLLNINVIIDGKNQTLYNAIKLYVDSVLLALKENDAGKIILFDDYEL